MRPLIIAVAQSVASPDIAANGRHIRDLIAQASRSGARLVLFHEGALSGYAKSEIRDWEQVDWPLLHSELDAIAACCAANGIYAVVGSAHRLGANERPHNSLYIISDTGALITRYDKRRLSNSEINDWYTPGFEPVTFNLDGFRFGCALCIEVSFPDLFAEYEALDVDCVLFSSYGLGPAAAIQLQAHAATTCMWIGVSVPAGRAPDGPSGVIGPDGQWLVRATEQVQGDLQLATLDRDYPAFEIALGKARPWRRRALEGNFYAERRSTHPRSADRSRF